jgi:hypothetical protein
MAGADATATFALDLESNAGEVAPDAAGAIEQLRDQIRGGVDELRGMQTALRLMKGSGAVAATSIQDLKDKITAQKAVVGQLQSRYVGLGGSFRQVKPPAQQAGAGIRELLESIRATPGPLSAFAGRLGAIRGLVAGGAIVGGIVAIAAGMVVLAASAVAATAALARYGLAQADARRSELLRLEGLAKHRNYWLAAAGFTRVADSAQFLQSTIDQVSDQVALGRDKINEYAASLYKAGLRGGNLQAALEGVSIVASVQGDAAAEAWKGWAMGAAITGQSVRALSNDVKARLGGIAARQLLSLDVQSRKLKENMGRIFSGIRIEGMLAGISKVTELFSQSTATGRALKVLAETFLSPIADAVGDVGPIVKDFFRGMVLGAQYFTIAVLEVRLWLKKTFGDPEILKGIDSTRIALGLGIGVVGGLAGAFAALAIPVVAIVGAFAIAGLGAYGLYKAVREVWNELKSINWAQLGNDVIDGIVNGIKAGIGRVKAAIKSVGDSIQSVFSARMLIRSPSRVMVKAGGHVSGGVAAGIDAERPQAVRAVRRLAAVPREEFRPQRPAQVPPSAARRTPVRDTVPTPRIESIADVTQLFAPRVVANDTRPTNERRQPGSQIAAAARVAVPPVRIPSPHVDDSPAPVTRIPAGKDDLAPTPDAQRQPLTAGRSGPLVTIGQLVVQAEGKDAQAQALSVKRELERVLEGVAIELGAKVAA